MNITLTAIMGIPGSGKSYAVRELCQGFHARDVVVVSPDTIREELCDGNRSDMSKNDQVFALAHERILEALLAGNDLVLDATNITAVARAEALGHAATVRQRNPDWNVRSRLVVIQTPHVTSWERNAERTEWQVPGAVMVKMIGQFERSLGQVGYEPWDVIEFRRVA